MPRSSYDHKGLERFNMNRLVSDSKLTHLGVAVIMFAIGVVLGLGALVMGLFTFADADLSFGYQTIAFYSVTGNLLMSLAAIVLAIALTYRTWVARTPFYLVLSGLLLLILLIKTGEAQAISGADVNQMFDYSLNWSLAKLLPLFAIPAFIICVIAFAVRLRFISKNFSETEEVET